MMLCIRAEYRDRVDNTHASWSEGPVLKSRHGDQLYCLRFSWFFSDPPDECRDSILKLVHDRVLSDPYQFVIHLSPYHSTQYILSYWKLFVK
jgi:hypothetical protein